ncbi:hypothetical protein FGG08_001174 [Glutinoglossum americanum]|uniref:Uncharacterized protein n=1 Tax=Glutinoglossum americanum TaxID=1670608 RepID=A0A9P8I7C2_9PEZI|nr:hypothetical protein FGG08_001174 [Glutinoglossum americanum]
MAVPMGKRDIEWVTITDYTTLTIDMTTTVYVNPTAIPAPPKPTPEAPKEVLTTTTNSPALFFAPPVAPTPTTPAAVQQFTPAAAPSPPPAPPAPPAPPPAPTSPAPSPPAPPPSGGSSGGACSSGSPCSGDMTFYDAGLGSCGDTDDGESENVVALPHDFMGVQSNGNPYCGKSITIEYGGKKTTAIVKDKCMGCSGYSIDLSRKAFAELAPFSLGRVDCKWYFN